MGMRQEGRYLRSQQQSGDRLQRLGSCPKGQLSLNPALARRDATAQQKRPGDRIASPKKEKKKSGSQLIHRADMGLSLYVALHLGVGWDGKGE